MQPSNDFRNRFGSLSEHDRRLLAEEYRRRKLTLRLKRVARIAIAATRTNATARGRKWMARKRQALRYAFFIKTNSYRLAAVAILIVISITTILTPFIQASDTKPILLQENVKALIGDTRDDAKSYLKYDEAKKQYSFEVPKDNSDTNFQHTGRNADSYSASLAQNPTDGIVVTDKKTAIAVNIRPQFFTASARRSTTDNVVYRSGLKQLIYTLKYNGLKEDIIVPTYQEPNLNFAFTLRLPEGVEARLDSEGNIGIYSGDTSLYGSISYGSDSDRALVEKAKEKSEKTNLVMTIPYPVIKESNGTEHADHARFELGKGKVVKDKAALPENVPADAVEKLSSETSFNDYTVVIKAYNLRDLTYPISIDPTIQVTSSADFGNINQDNATVDTTNNLIKRTPLTGGLIGGWSGLSNFDTDNVSRHRVATASTSQGNFIYTLGDGSNNVRYASINSSGVLTWADTTNLPSLNAAPVVGTYNGYLYIVGGSAGGTVSASVYYAKINPNGTIGSWTPNAGSNNLLQAAHSAAGGAYNGYFYVVGGYNGASLQTVQYAKLNADGSTSAWAFTTNIPVGRFRPSASFYNNRIYVTGGINGSTHFNTGIYGAINDDGTVSSWTNLPNMTANRSGHAMSAYGGYLYAWGGCSAESINICSTYNATTEFAEIFADGSIGSWRTTNTFSTGRTMMDGAIVNGYIYTIGGCTSYNYTSGSCASGQALQTVQYAQLQPVGTVGSFQAQSNYDTTGREGAAVLVARNSIWLFGGYDGTNYLNTVRKTTINTDGTLNTWSTASDTLPKAKAYMAIVNAPNGAQVSLYGGYGNCGLLNSVDYCDDWETADYSFGAYISSWTASVTATLPTARSGMSAVFNRNYVYLLGGTDSNGVSNTVWRGVPTSAAALNNAGCGSNTWCVDTSFTNARTDATAIHDNNYIYLIGGRNGATYYRTVQYALIGSSNGALSTNSCGTGVTWCTTTSINTDRSAHSAFVRNGYIYIAGGCNTGSGCTADLNSVEYAPVNGTNGALGSWINNPQTFPTARSYASIGHFDGFMYVIGGNTGASRATDVQYGYVGNGGVGKMTSFTAPGSAALSSARSYLSVVVYGGYMYIAGGCTAFTSGACSAILNSIEYAKLNTDGSFSTNTCNTSLTWCSTTSLPDTAYAGQLLAFRGYLYYIGGTNSLGVTGSVDSIAINASGSLSGSWNTTNNPPDLITARTRFAMTFSDTHVYVINGFDTNATALFTGEYATLLPNGNLSNWTGFSNVPSAVNGRAVAFIANNRLYVVGGGVFVSGFHTALNADGSLSGTWTQQPWVNTFPTDAIGFRANGYLFYGDGASLLKFNLVSGGGIEPSSESYNFNSTSGTNKHDGGAGVYYKGNYYMLGGCDAGFGLNCTSLNNLVEYAGVKAIPRIAAINKLYDFDTGVKPTKLITRGGRSKAGNLSASYSTTNNTNTTFDNLQTLDVINYGGTNLQTINLGTNRTLSRYLSLTYRLDDTSAVTYPETGQESYITDFDMYYVSNPGARLRGGRTFTNGVDRGLDVQPQ